MGLDFSLSVSVKTITSLECWSACIEVVLVLGYSKLASEDYIMYMWQENSN